MCVAPFTTKQVLRSMLAAPGHVCADGAGYSSAEVGCSKSAVPSTKEKVKVLVWLVALGAWRVGTMALWPWGLGFILVLNETVFRVVSSSRCTAGTL